MTETPAPAGTAAAAAPDDAPTDPPLLAEEAERRLPAVYDSAGNLQIELEGIVHRHPDALLTPAQIGAFNQILADARRLAPHSVALREDVAEVSEATRPEVVHHALKTTIVPTLHNALPEDAYEARG